MPNPVPATKKDILTLTIARADTRQPIPGEVWPRPRLRPVLAARLREPVTKLRSTPTVTAVPAGTAHHVLKDIRQLHPRFALVARYLESATNVK